MNRHSDIGYGYNIAIEKLAEELAVPQDRFDQAESRYKDLGEFLHRAESVRRQGFWDRRRPELREGLAHLVVLIMRPICGEASAGFRWSFV